MRTPQTSERGAIAIFMALVIVFILMSSAILFNSILARQIRLSGEISSSERAFYAANTGFEKALFDIATLPDLDFEGEGEVEYDNGETAEYKYKAQAVERNDLRIPCVLSTGTHRNESRRLFSGPDDCDLL